MNIMEQQIWDYLDGNCSLQESKRIDHLILIDPVYRSLYAELRAFHDQVSIMDLDEPSMGFTRNVMDKIAAGPAPVSIRTLVDKRIIYGIAAFFLVSILALLALVFVQIDWSKTVTDAPQLKLPRVDYSSYFNGTYLQVFFVIDLILGLYILDSVMRKRMLSR
jgi:hypothetical protein